MPPILAPVLTIIFQASLDQGQVTDDRRIAYVTPLFKKGDKAKSIRSVSCKVVEYTCKSFKFLRQTIFSQMNRTAYENTVLVRNTVVTMNDLVTGLDNNPQIDAVTSIRPSSQTWHEAPSIWGEREHISVQRIFLVNRSQ